MEGKHTSDSDILKKEYLGNVLYYAAEMCIAHNWSMEDLAEESLKKYGQFVF
jgi:hypothetical protein